MLAEASRLARTTKSPVEAGPFVTIRSVFVQGCSRRHVDEAVGLVVDRGSELAQRRLVTPVVVRAEEQVSARRQGDSDVRLCAASIAAIEGGQRTSCHGRHGAPLFLLERLSRGTFMVPGRRPSYHLWEA